MGDFLFKKTEKLEFFYENIKNNPLPLLFLPREDINHLSNFLKNCGYSLSKQPIAVFEKKGCGLMLLSFINLVELGLDYMVNPLLSNSDINVAMFGFLYKLR